MSDVSKIKEVRERTGIGFSDCKKALIEADWDVEQALAVIREQSAVKAAKKADRTAAEGRLAIKIGDDRKSGAIVEVNIETDFAARNERFESFCETVIENVLEQGPTAIESLDQLRQELVHTIGENISIRRAEKFTTTDGFIVGYVHTNGTVGALVEMESGDARVGEDIAMHVTAMNPMVVSEDQLSTEVIEREREILTQQALETGKPENIVEKIVEGRLRAFQKEVCLIHQDFVMDQKVDVKSILKSGNASCKRFVRYQVGEGIEKRESELVN